MRYELVFQDPSADDPAYLYECIVRELAQPSVSRFDGVFAFASWHGVSSLLEDPDLERFLERGGSCSLVVGIDAITDPRTLDLLESMCNRYGTLQVSVFYNDVADLFHPKLSRFVHNDGSATIVVGSGNLTPGGLRRNIEAYAVAEIAADEVGVAGNLDAWDDFIGRHADRIRPIDDDARDAARRNQVIRRRRLRDVEPEGAQVETVTAAEEALADEVLETTGLRDDQRMLLAQVPAAGGRWNQVHFNREAIEEYFRAEPNSPQRVFLYEVLEDGSLAEVEVRPVVFSQCNVNHKIEFRAHHGDDYPESGPPLLVLRETATRVHRYQMLFPGDDGYVELTELLKSKPPMGRGMLRAIVAASEVLAAWPECIV